MEAAVATIKTIVAAYALKVIGALLFLFAAFMVANWARRMVEKMAKTKDLDLTVSRFLASMTRWAILLLAFIATLGIFGVETTSFAAALAGAGLAIGLAFQGSLSNLASGIMLLVFRPFKVGDVISVGGQTGKVDAINLFTTTMDTPDNRRIIIPNGGIFGSTIENLTHHDVRRVDVAVGVDYTADMDKTREVLEQAAQAVPGRLEDNGFQVILLSLGDSALDWQVRVWAKTEDYWDVLDAATREVKKALDAASIGIPFPQMDVHLDKNN
ncbi:MAG: mechanosensitive ion channel [Deltaproteobacteria bacterium]|nr:mechanosensitive ion channel [Deltaproteobacteria bacterium]